MRTEINRPVKRSIRINAETILKYLISSNEEIDTKIICKDPNVNLITTDKDVYQALGSIKQQDNFQLNKLTKFFENVDIISWKERTRKEKGVLTFERVEELRKMILNNHGGQNDKRKNNRN